MIYYIDIWADEFPDLRPSGIGTTHVSRTVARSGLWAPPTEGDDHADIALWPEAADNFRTWLLTDR